MGRSCEFGKGHLKNGVGRVWVYLVCPALKRQAGPIWWHVAWCIWWCVVGSSFRYVGEPILGYLVGFHFGYLVGFHFEVPSTKKLRHQARKKRTSRGWLVNHYAFVFKRILIASHIFWNTFSSLPVTKYDNLARRFFSNRVPQNGTQSRTLKWNPIAYPKMNPTKYPKTEPNRVP